MSNTEVNLLSNLLIFHFHFSGIAKKNVGRDLFPLRLKKYIIWTGLGIFAPSSKTVPKNVSQLFSLLTSSPIASPACKSNVWT